MPVISATWEAEVGGWRTEATPGKTARLSENQSKNKRIRDVVQVSPVLSKN
jgi:hypothetical protein